MIETLESEEIGRNVLRLVKYEVKESAISKESLMRVDKDVLLFKVISFKPPLSPKKLGYNFVKNFKDYNSAKFYFDCLQRFLHVRTLS